MTVRAIGFLLALIVPIFTTCGCERIGGKRVEVESRRSAEGVESGCPVYFASVRIATAGTPRIVEGHARLPARLFRSHRDAFPDGVVFLITAHLNEAGKRCPQVHPADGINRRLDGDVQVFMGVANRFELPLLVDGQKAAEL